MASAPVKHRYDLDHLEIYDMRQLFYIISPLILSALILIPSAQADRDRSALRDIFVRMQTGYQSPALGSQVDFSGALDFDVALGYTLPHLVLEANLGLSFSLGSSKISDLAQRDRYFWSKAEGLIYYRLGSGRNMLLLGGGLGIRHLDQSVRYNYQEGMVLQLTSDTQRSISEYTVSSLVRLVVMTSFNLTFSIDYDHFSLEDHSSPIHTLGVNMGVAY